MYYRNTFLSLIALSVMTFLAFGSVDGGSGGGGSSSGSSGSSSTPRVDRADKIDAWIMAKDFVTDNLKSPSTADFGGAFSGEYQSPEDNVVDLGGGKFRASGWVDAQNSFGATIRSNWTCTVEYQGDDKWRCTSISIN